MKARCTLARLPENPRVSVIVPSFNQGRYIRQTLESCLSQDYRPIEILVIDGASSDSTVTVLHDYDRVPEIRWQSEPDKGPVDAVNKGLALATGEIGLIQSADDLSTSGAFLAAVEAFRTTPDVGLVYGDVEMMSKEGEPRQRIETGAYSLLSLFARCTWVPQPSGFFRVDLARRLGGWDDRFPYCPDTELWFRLALSSRVRKLNRVLGRTRVHEAQRDQRKVEVYASCERMVRESEMLANSPLHCRMALLAGVQLAKLRYNPGLTDRALCRSLWKAVVLYPPCLLSPALPKHRLVPRYFLLAGWAGAIRRRLWRKQKP